MHSLSFFICPSSVCLRGGGRDSIHTSILVSITTIRVRIVVAVNYAFI